MTDAQGKLRVTLAALGVLTSSFTGTAAIAAKEPVILQSTSKWQLDYADESCRLARQFGEGEQASFLIFSRYQPGDSFSLTVAGKPVGGAKIDGDADIRFGPGEESAKQHFNPGELGGQPAMIFNSMAIGKEDDELLEKSSYRWDKDDPGESFAEQRNAISPERVAAVTYVQVDAYGFSPIRFETGSLKAPMNALETCMDELMGHWGIDVARNKAATRMPVPDSNPGKWVVPSDYPRDLLDKGAQGVVAFRLNIDEQGKVTDCKIQASTRPEGFDIAVCKAIIRRARFRPALDADGKPLASYWMSQVRFEIY